MLETVLDLAFISDWHVGSGLGDGAVADAVLIRDINGIPVIPGSAVKGALREGAWRLALADEENLEWLVEHVFGSDSRSEISNKPGIISVSQAQLPEDLRGWLAALEPGQRGELVGDMLQLRQQTALDEKRMVVPHSLRSIECGISGLRFSASLALDIPADAEAWLADWLAAVCACVKSVGGDRARGLGRCRLRLRGADRKSFSLPGPLPDALKEMRGVDK